MKYLRFIYAILAASLLTACEVVSENEQLIPIETEENNRTTLIVEFSGLKCNNCPLAAEEAHKLLNLYGENLVVVEMHPASNPLTNGGDKWDYTCQAADEYYKHWNIPSLPYGVVNMRHLENYQTWGAAYLQSSKVASPIELEHAIQVASGNTLQIEVNFQNISDDSLEVQYIAWLVEDSIIGGQLLSDGKTMQEDYVHNHVLRDAITDTWGTPITIAAKSAETVSLEYTLPNHVNAAKCKIVGIAIKDDEAIQVDEQAVQGVPSATLSNLELSIITWDEDEEEIITYITKDTTVIVTEYEEDIFTGGVIMSLNGNVTTTSDKMHITIERSSADVYDEFCLGNCFPGNEELKQEIEIPLFQETEKWFTHFYPNKEGTTIIKYTFDDGISSVKTLTVEYRYQP